MTDPVPQDNVLQGNCRSPGPAFRWAGWLGATVTHFQPWAAPITLGDRGRWLSDTRWPTPAAGHIHGLAARLGGRTFVRDRLAA